jgi:hypothetical protein
MAAASSEPAAKKMRSTNYITVETRLFKFMIEKSVSGKFAIVDTEGQVHCSERVTDIAGMPW